MAFSIVIVSAILAIFGHESSAQMFSGRPGLGMMTGQSLWGQGQDTFRTCIGQTAAGDELRVTFSQRGGQAATRTRFGASNANNRLKVEADITSGSISGVFQLVATEYGRIDGVCESGSLGEIVSSQPRALSMFAMWGQGQGQGTPSAGLIGTQFELSPRKSVSLTDNINTGLTMDMISGGGMALCPVQQLVGGRCIDVISLCCSIAKDNKPANQHLQASVQGGMIGGMQNNMGNMQMSQMNNMQMAPMNNMQMSNRGMQSMNGGMGNMNGGMGNMNGQMGGRGGMQQGRFNGAF